MPDMARKPLRDWQKQDADRLYSIFKQRKVETGITQESLAETVGATQSAVSQYLRGVIPLNLQMLVKLSMALDVHPEVISPELASKFIPGVKSTEKGVPDAAFSELAVKEYGRTDLYDSDIFTGLPVLNAEAAAGHGYSNGEEYPRNYLLFQREYLEKCGVDESNAALVEVIGSSMEPVLSSGDMVGVDRGQRFVIDGSTYAINDLDLLRVKRLYRLPGGGLRLSSFNVAEYPDETLSAEDVADRIKIIGKVFWSSKTW